MANIKNDFPILSRKINGKQLVYLDNSATSQKPKQVLQATNNFYEKDNANVGRGVYSLAARATKRYEDARKVVAKFIGADSNEVILTRNTTESINLLSYVLFSIISEDKKSEDLW